MNTSVISVAHSANNADVARTVLASDEIRRRTLEKCYSIIGYSSLTLSEKNKIYDEVKQAILIA